MSVPARDWLALVASPEEDQLMRLAAFRTAHPEVTVRPGEFGTWEARIPEPDGETTIVRHTLREVLDKLGVVLGGGCSCQCSGCLEGGAWLSGHCGNKNSGCNM